MDIQGGDAVDAEADHRQRGHIDNDDHEQDDEGLLVQLHATDVLRLLVFAEVVYAHLRRSKSNR